MTLPQAFVRIALAANDVTATTERKGGKKYTAVSFTAANKAKTTGWINDQNLVERVETKIDNNVYGDIVFETAFSDYKTTSTVVNYTGGIDGIGTPVAIGVGLLVFGAVVMVIANFVYPQFFRRKRETAPPGFLEGPASGPAVDTVTPE